MSDIRHEGTYEVKDRRATIYFQPHNCTAVTIQNRSTSNAYLGDEGVTSDSGILLGPGAIITFSGDENPTKLWAISDDYSRLSVHTFVK